MQRAHFFHLHVQPGDVLIDGGNEWFPNSIRRAKALSETGILYMGIGVSGGEEGARNGPSLMPGGPREAYDLVEPMLSKVAAITDSGPCVTYLGEIGSGNYVKMVHNGIEYGDMQLIAEAYDILKTVGGLANTELAEVFAEWNGGELESFLIEITAAIFRKKDDKGGDGYLLDKVLDKTGMKGTGRWTVQEGAERSVAAPTIEAALDARFLSGRKEERMEAERVLSGPGALPGVDKTQLIADVRAALYASKICSYAQGMNIIKEASAQLGVASAVENAALRARLLPPGYLPPDVGAAGGSSDEEEGGADGAPSGHHFIAYLPWDGRAVVPQSSATGILELDGDAPLPCVHALQPGQGFMEGVVGAATCRRPHPANALPPDSACVIALVHD